MDTITTAAERWLSSRYARGEIAARTRVNYGDHLHRFAQHVGPARPLASITTTDVEGWLASLAVAPSTRNTMAATIRAMFGDLLARGEVTANPTAPIRQARVPKRPPRRIPPEQLAAVLAVASPRVHTLVVVTLQTMARRSELAGLAVEDYDRAAGTLYLKGKGAKDRVVPVPAEARAELARHLAGRTVGAMWPGPDGQPVSGGHLNRTLGREAATVGVRVTLHDLRHTGASDVAAGGGSLVALRDILGHASLAMTSRYLWAAQVEMRQAIEGRAYKVAS